MDDPEQKNWGEHVWLLNIYFVILHLIMNPQPELLHSVESWKIVMDILQYVNEKFTIDIKLLKQ